MVNFDINADEYSPLSEGGNMPPPGDHKMIVTEADLEPNKKQNGHNVVIAFQVVDGPHAGKDIKRWYAIDHPNPKAVEIAKQHLANIGKAIGVNSIKGVSDLEKLKNKQFIGRIATQYDKESGQERGVEIINYADTKGFQREFKDRLPPVGARPEHNTNGTHPLDKIDEIPF